MRDDGLPAFRARAGSETSLVASAAVWSAARPSWPWAALPLAAALAVDPGGLAPFGPAKWAAVPTLVFAGTALLLANGTRRTSLAATWPDRALPLFVAWSAVAAVLGLDRLYAWTGTPERHFGVLAWVLVLLCWWGAQNLD